MDLVYIVRNGDENNELLYSLRSIAKYAPSVDNVWVVGYKPTWVSNKVKYIATHQKNKSSGWINARFNVLYACLCDEISDNFILMNDDFIATRKISDWAVSTMKVENTLEAEIQKWKDKNFDSHYTRAFIKTLNILKGITDDDLFNYELHMPMIINKKKFLDMLQNSKIKEDYQSKDIVLYRTLYGNYYHYSFNEIIDDVKIYNNDIKPITTEWISVFDDWIGDHKKYPRLNRFIDTEFNKKCIYEK